MELGGREDGKEITSENDAVIFAADSLYCGKMQTSLSVNNQRENTQEKLDEMQEIIDSADETANQNNLSYDEVY